MAESFLSLGHGDVAEARDLTFGTTTLYVVNIGRMQGGAIDRQISIHIHKDGIDASESVGRALISAAEGMRANLRQAESPVDESTSLQPYDEAEEADLRQQQESDEAIR